MRSLAGTVILVSLLAAFGCGKKADPKALQGRWLDQKADAFLDFTPSGLCAWVIKSPDSLAIYRWQLNGNQMQMTPQGYSLHFGSNPTVRDPGPAEVWDVELVGDALAIRVGSKTRRYKRVGGRTGHPDLEGLWKRARPDHKVNYWEFTAWGDELGLLWPPVGSKFTQQFPEWHTYAVRGNKVEMDGYSILPGFRHFLNPYRLEAGTLLFPAPVRKGVPRITLSMERAAQLQ